MTSPETECPGIHQGPGSQKNHHTLGIPKLCLPLWYFYSFLSSWVKGDSQAEAVSTT